MDKLSVLVLILFSDSVWALPGSSQCGIPLSRGKIVGGVDSNGYRYPWFALLLLKKNSYIPVPICAGSLITNFHVLTAAHCFTINASIQNENLFSVALGVYDICSDSEPTRQIFNVENVAVHEKFQRSGKFYDIALIKLDRLADYTSICLPFPSVPDLTEIALLIGFGVTEENSNFVPCHLLEVNVTKFSRKDCSRSKLPQEDKEEPSVICAGTGDADSCYGDSGGPLQTKTSDGRMVIAGIVSYGYGCGTPEVPGVYTNVGSYLQWISKKISSLGFNTRKSNKTRNRNPPYLINQRRRESRRRLNTGVPFFEHKTTSLGPDVVKSPINFHHFEGRKFSRNDSILYANNETHQSGLFKNSKKNSITFPE